MPTIAKKDREWYDGWKNEWKDMPEFEQENQQGIKTIIIRFEDLESMEEFSKLVGRPITMKTRGFYFPIKKKKETQNYYIDEEEDS